MTRMASAASSRALDRRRGAEPGHAEVQRVVVRDDVGAPPGRDDGHLEELGEAQELGRGPGAQDAAAGEDHRAAGAGQQLDDGASSSGVARGTAGRLRVRPLEQHHLVEQVLRQRQEHRSGTAGQRLRGRPRAMAPGTSSAGAAPPPTWPDRRWWPTWSISWNASRPWNARSTWPTSANIGRRVLAGGVDPDGRGWRRRRRGSPRQAAGRPVSWPCASAMNAAPPSWRVATTRIPASAKASRRPRNDSPGTVKAYRTPAARRASAMNRPTVRAGQARARAPVRRPRAPSPRPAPARRPRLARRCRLGVGRVGLRDLGLGSTTGSGSAAPGSASARGLRPPRRRRSRRGRSAAWDLARSWSDRHSCGGSVCQRDGDGGQDRPEHDHGRDDQHHGLGDARSGHGGSYR